MKYWETLVKSKRPQNKSYELLLSHVKDQLVPCKFQFFSFIAGILQSYLVIFQTDRPMLPFVGDELQKIIKNLIRLVFKKSAIDEAGSITNLLKNNWISDRANFLDVVNVGAAAKDQLEKSQVVSLEKKRKFRNDCGGIILKLLLKLSERCPLKFSLVRNATSLSPANIAANVDEFSIRFSSLADRLYALNKIKANTADNAKSQYDEFVKFVHLHHKDEFLNFDLTKDRLVTFLRFYLSGKKEYEDLWSICIIIFIFSHGQSNIERGFSVNKEILVENMSKSSLIAQRIVYDRLKSEGIKCHEFSITSQCRKSCKLASSRYKAKLSEDKESRSSSDKNRKRKLKLDEIDIVKRSKVSIQASIDQLRLEMERETLEADQTESYAKEGLVKVASYVKMIIEKQKKLQSLEKTETFLEEEYKLIE